MSKFRLWTRLQTNYRNWNGFNKTELTNSNSVLTHEHFASRNHFPTQTQRKLLKPPPIFRSFLHGFSCTGVHTVTKVFLLPSEANFLHRNNAVPWFPQVWQMASSALTISSQPLIPATFSLRFWHVILLDTAQQLMWISIFSGMTRGSR